MADDKKVVTLRLPEDLYDRLNTLAEAEYRSLNGEATALLVDAIEQREKELVAAGK